MPGRECRLSTERDNFIAVLDADGRRFGLVVDCARRSRRDRRQAAHRGAQEYRPFLRRHRARQCRSGAHPRSRIDRHEGRRDHEQRGRIRAGRRGRKREPTPPAHATTCWWKWPDARPRCRWPTCCASSSFRSRASNTSATGPVLNFEGQLLPVEDSGGILAAAAGQIPRPRSWSWSAAKATAMWASRFRTCSTWPPAAISLRPEPASAPAASRCSRIASPAWSIWAACRRCLPLKAHQGWQQTAEALGMSTSTAALHRKRKNDGAGGSVFRAPRQNAVRRSHPAHS